MIGEPESVIDPHLPIIDSHHHLWLLPEETLRAMELQDTVAARALVPTYRRQARYLLDEYLKDISTGHNIVASVHVDAYTMYRSSGPEAMKSLGEVEFINGIAALSESGLLGSPQVAAGIVGSVDLSAGDAVDEVLIAHQQAAGGRYRGVRSPRVVHDEDARILGPGVGVPHLLLDRAFRRGFKRLSAHGLSFDVWLFEPQLPDLIDLARTFPETPIILDHVGTPMGVGRYAGLREERFPIWQKHIRMLSACANVVVKLGGLGIPFGGFRSYAASPPLSSAQLADEWRPYIETCIEAFGASRCMFQSNFPVDSAVGSYDVLWNAFKRLASGASQAEKRALFYGTAVQVYRPKLQADTSSLGIS